MSKPTTESVERSIDWFLSSFESFNERIDERPNKAMYVKTSDRISLFTIYCKR